MKTILITGSNGFIGTCLANKYKNQGYIVVGWDIVTKDTALIKTNIVDLTSFETVKAEIEQLRPDVVIHCAGAADVSRSVTEPDFDYHCNVTATHNLLFALYQAGLKNARVVFLSSAAVYGNPTSLPIREDTERNPLSPYALHKAMCEDICLYFIKNYSMDIKIIRIFSAYGVGLRKQIFWDIHQKYNKNGRLDMFGSGDESRDYISVADVVQSIYLVSEKAAKEDSIFNVANGEETTIRQATECFADCAGISRQLVKFSGVRREGEPINWRADIFKMKELGYQKSVSLGEGLTQYIEWVKNL